MSDKNTIHAKLSYIAEALKELQDALSLYSEKSDTQRHFYYSAQKKAEEIVESAIAINQFILLEKLNKQSASYTDSFLDLEPLNILSKSDLKKFAKTAKFRNRLAHDYVHMEISDTVKLMEEILKIYPDYVKKIYNYL